MVWNRLNSMEIEFFSKFICKLYVFEIDLIVWKSFCSDEAVRAINGLK